MQNKVGDIVEGVVVRVYPRYAILLFKDNGTGLLHISELSSNYIYNFSALVKVGNIYKCKIISIDEESQSIKVSVKQLTYKERKRNFYRQKVDPKEISFDALERQLPIWINERKCKGDNII